MRNNGLRNIIKATEEQARVCGRGDHSFLDEKVVGATMGQILYKDQWGKLTMKPCWMAIQAAKDVTDDQYKVALRPLCKTGSWDYYCTYLSKDMVKSLTGLHHHFGGETVSFQPLAYPRFVIENDLRDMTSQVKNFEIMDEVTRASRQMVREDYIGRLVICDTTIFEIGKPKADFTDKYGCFVREYDRLTWVEPSNECQNPDDWSERDVLYNTSIPTPYNTTVVPTIWIKENGESDCFLSFAEQWRQSRKGDRVSCNVGKFVVTHELQCKGNLITRTSLREEDSIWYNRKRA